MRKLGRIPERDLLRRAQRGDQDAFAEFYRRYREPLVARLARQTRNPDTAIDLMAETFARALVAVTDRSREVPDFPVAWLFSIANNLLIDSARRAQVEASARQQLQMAALSVSDDDIDRVVELADAVDIAARLRSMVSEEEWELLQARLLEEESYRDIAERLTCSQDVVRKRVSRARARVQSLGDHSV